MSTAITVWVDESTEIQIGGGSYNLIGYLITNSDQEEFFFLNRLKQARKENPSCWTTIHGSELGVNDKRRLSLIDRWLKIFRETEGVYFHSFLYRRNETYIPRNESYEHYFAKQSIFSLANKMKTKGYTLNTMFKDVATLTVLFDRRRAHVANITVRQRDVQFERINELENIYKEQICSQILRISGKNASTSDFTVRFSFLSSECFDGMQFSDAMLYLMRKKIEQEEGSGENVFTELFDKHFMSGLEGHVRNMSFRSVYEYSKKLNVFESNS